MATSVSDPAAISHVVAIPFPGRGHINPMLHFCKLIATHRRPNNVVVTFIVTEEWHGFLSSEILPENLHLTSIPQVIPSEIGRGKDWPGFVRATMTKMEEPVEQLLDRLPLPKPCVIIFDTYMKWVVGIGNRRDIPVASFFTQSAAEYLIFYYFDLIVQHGHSNVDVSEKGEELVDYIPGLSPLRVIDLPTVINGTGKEILPPCLECISLVSKSQFLLFTSTYELEAQVIDHLRKKYSIPVYSIGPAIPYQDISSPSDHNTLEQLEYMKWLDVQPTSSVIYISQGSFLSVSSTQMDEIVAGVYDSGVRFFWIARDEAIQSKGGRDANGIVVPWCNQLRVLSHPSVGGFWSHCGWNSTKEGLYAGVPMLCFPISFDQVTNAKNIVEDWKTGWRVKKDDDGGLITRDEIAGLLKRFMDLESDEGKEMRRRAKEWQDVCVKASENGGSSYKDVDAFCQAINHPDAFCQAPRRSTYLQEEMTIRQERISDKLHYLTHLMHLSPYPGPGWTQQTHVYNPSGGACGSGQPSGAAADDADDDEMTSGQEMVIDMLDYMIHQLHLSPYPGPEWRPQTHVHNPFGGASGSVQPSGAADDDD